MALPTVVGKAQEGEGLYCAEQFENDETMPSLIMKSLKRVMAGEYSRELGVKIFAGQANSAKRGFRQGGYPGYGLRRLLVSAEGRPKQLLNDGERKSIVSDRVILIPGPDEEVRCVREIYRMLIQKGMSFSAIANELNRRRVRYRENSAWSLRAVEAILTKPKYAGFNVYGRTSCKLYTAPVPVPRSKWTIVAGAFEAVVEPATYSEAQQIIGAYTRNRSEEQMVEDLRAILAKEGRITADLVARSPNTPSLNTYARHFGALSRAYKLIGYSTRKGGQFDNRRHVRALRNNLMHEVVSLSQAGVYIEETRPVRHTRLRLQSGRRVAVLASRCLRGYKGAIRWLLKPTPSERRLPALVARLNIENDTFRDFFVLPPIGISTGVVVSERDSRLRHGVQLRDLRKFVGAVRTVCNRGQVVTIADTAILRGRSKD